MNTRRKLLSLTVLLCLCAMGCGLFVDRIPSGEILRSTDKDHFIRINGLNYHYTEYPGEGQVVFMLHGFGSSTYSWERTAPLLQQRGYRVYALDMKGFGWSDKPKGADYSALALVACVNDWMSAMGLKDVVFVGNSLGGAIAVLMSILHPDKVGSMVLVDAAGYPMDFPLIVKVARIPTAGFFTHLFFGRWLVKWNLKEVVFDNDSVTREQIDAYYDRLRTSNGLGAMVALCRSVDLSAFEKYEDRANELKVPILIIWGEEDKWVPLEIGHRYDKELPNSRLVVIPECGHIPQEEKPGVTADLIAGFIQETGEHGQAENLPGGGQPQSEG